MHTPPSERQRRPVRRRGRVALAALAGVVVLGAAACSNDQPSATCQALEDVKSSVDDLENVDRSDGINGLTTGLQAVQSSVEDLGSTATDEFGDEVDNLSQSLSEATNAIGSVGDDPSSETLDQLGGAVQGVASAWDSLESTADRELSDCDL